METTILNLNLFFAGRFIIDATGRELGCIVGGGGGSRISGKGVHMYKGVGGSLADFISFFLNIP